MKFVSSATISLCGLLPISAFANPVIDMIFPAAQANGIPEPTTLALLAIGAAAVGVSTRAKNRKK